ncbi:hypothetical protein, partial [Bacillus pumilus]|uniref:hypothetical protein n=1 Tax=Bacillus pumilus TaxID=1408 RepID=UPI001C92E714
RVRVCPSCPPPIPRDGIHGENSAFSPHAPAGSTIPGPEADPAGKANPPLPAWRQKQPRAGNSSPAPEPTHGGRWNGTWLPGRRHPIRP